MSKTREALVSLKNAGVRMSDKWLVRGVKFRGFPRRDDLQLK